MPLTELISEQLSDDSSYADGTPACSVNFAGGGEDPNTSGIILGDSFLRSAYVVYDLENRIIAIAQAKLDNSPPINSAAITAIPSGTALPGVTRTVTVTATQPTDTTGLDANLGTPGDPDIQLAGRDDSVVESHSHSSGAAEQRRRRDRIVKCSWGGGRQWV